MPPTIPDAFSDVLRIPEVRTRRFVDDGTYPNNGQNWGLKGGQPSDRPEADRNIKRVSLPGFDPVYGSDGPLVEHWDLAS